MAISATFLFRDLASEITSTVLKLIIMMTRPQIMNMTEIRFCMILRVKNDINGFYTRKKIYPLGTSQLPKRKIYKKMGT